MKVISKNIFMKRILVFLFILITIFNCKEECVFNEGFLSEKANFNKPKLLITTDSSDSSCNELLLKGKFYYDGNEYDITDKIYLNDSTYLYTSSKNEIIFDFTEMKNTGVLKVNNNLELPINYFMDIKSNEGIFRLFKIDEIGKFHELSLSIVLVANYNYGIVGNFIATKENENWYAIDYNGYIPNEECFFSIFQSAELL